MGEIRIFNNPMFGEIRTSGTSDMPLFCLADLCKAVELKNPSSVKKRLDASDVQLVDLHALNSTNPGNSLSTFVTESGFYDVLLYSSSKSVRPFRKWVTSEVLPAIRRQGGYLVSKDGETDEEIMARALLVAQAAIKRKEERIKALECANEAHAKEIAFVKAENETLKSKQTYLDAILQSRSTVLVTSIAQDYGMSAVAFNKKLADYGIQRRVRGQWILFGKFLNQGYVHSHTVNITHKDGRHDVKLNTEWTQKGRIFLYNELKNRGILPVIERCS